MAVQSRTEKLEFTYFKNNNKVYIYAGKTGYNNVGFYTNLKIVIIKSLRS